MAHNSDGNEAMSLPISDQPDTTTSLETMITATTDNPLHHLKRKRDLEHDITFLPGWTIHADVIESLVQKGCWEDVQELSLCATKLWTVGTTFDMNLDSMLGKYFLKRPHPTNQRIEVMKMQPGAKIEWNEKMSASKKLFDAIYTEFLHSALRDNLENRVKECFAAHSHLGIDGDGEKWWMKTVDYTLVQGEKWFNMPHTVEMSLKALAHSTGDGEKWQEIEIYADVLHPALDGNSVVSKEELIYVLRGGEVIRNANMTWVSDELWKVVKQE